MSKQVRKGSECEECEERNKTVEDVMKKLEQAGGGKEPQEQKKNIFDLFKDIKGGTLFAENENQITVLTVKVKLSWQKD